MEEDRTGSKLLACMHAHEYTGPHLHSQLNTSPETSAKQPECILRYTSKELDWVKAKNTYCLSSSEDCFPRISMPDGTMAGGRFAMDLTCIVERLETGLLGGLDTEEGRFEGVPFVCVTTLEW